MFNIRAMAKKKTTKPTKTSAASKTAKSPALRRSGTGQAPATSHALEPTTGAPDTAQERALETNNARTLDGGQSPREVGALTGIEIGHVAGEVWGALTRNGALTVAAIKKEVKAPGDVVAAAIGWLAREEKLNFDTAGRVVKISLR
jgi:hypothetical protein